MPRKPKQPFIAKVLEQLAELDFLSYKAMFGCYGLYSESVFFAIVCGEELYFKTDERSRQEFVKRGMEPFIFREEQRSNNYYRVPDAIFENPKQLKKWALTAVEAQRSSKKSTKSSKPDQKDGEQSSRSTKPSKKTVNFRDLPVLSIALVMLSLLLHPPALCASKKVLELVQVHTLGGRQKLYLAKDAIRMEHANSGMVIISRAPFTEILVINPKKKLYTRKDTKKTVEKMLRVQIIASVTNQLSNALSDRSASQNGRVDFDSSSP
jgi:Regulator of competence-specific genes